ncbi:MAG: hypothetical protein ACI90V_013967, partial [Bacillariaceae sp.]
SFILFSTDDDDDDDDDDKAVVEEKELFQLFFVHDLVVFSTT